MKVVRLGDVAERINIKVDQANTHLEYYVGGEHIESSELKLHHFAPIKNSTIGYQFQFGFRDGDILFMTKNPHLRKCTMANFEGLCSIATFVIHTMSDELLQDFLLFEMQSDRFWQYCEDHKSGGVNYFINWGTLANYEFTLPSLSEQKVLADKLWAAYRVKESYKKLLAATDDMLKAKFMEMKNAASQMVPLSDICIVQKGSNLTRNNAIDGIYPVIAGGQIPSCYHNTYNREGHVISVSASGAYAGFVNYWKTPIYASDCNTIISKSGDISETYFVYLGLKAMQNEVYKLQKGGAQPHVYGSDLELFSFPIIEKNLQQQFVEIATQAEATKESLRKSIENIDQVIKSLINQ